MKVLNNVLNVFCKMLTKYFAFWCPKENINNTTYADCSAVEFVEYENYYAAVTRWR